MKNRSDRFGALELSPRRDAPLMGSAPLDALTVPSVSLTLCVVSATALRPMQKGITSNPMCEISLVLDDGGPRLHKALHSTGDSKTDLKRLGDRTSHDSALGANGAVLAKTFKTKLVRSTLNPIWNMNVDFGDLNTESVLGVMLVVRHVEKMGLIKRDIGGVFVPMRDLLELKAQPTREQTFTLEATDDTNAREAQEGVSNRKYGKITLRFNSYGLSQSSPSLQNYTSLMDEKQDVRPAALSNGSVTHEDDFHAKEQPEPTPARRNVQAEIKKLQSLHQATPKPGEVWFAVQSQWIANWLLFVSRHRGKPEFNPGEIDNMTLISEDMTDGRFTVRPNLTIKKDFRMINKASWEFYVSQYGGGPAIEVPVPSDCKDTATWLTTLRLHEVARVGSGYFSSGSDE